MGECAHEAEEEADDHSKGISHCCKRGSGRVIEEDDSDTGRLDEFYLPWKCKNECHFYEKCEYELIMERMQKIRQHQQKSNPKQPLIPFPKPANTLFISPSHCNLLLSSFFLFHLLFFFFISLPNLDYSGLAECA